MLVKVTNHERQLIGVRRVKMRPEKCSNCQTKYVRYIKRLDETVGYCCGCVKTLCADIRSHYKSERSLNATSQV